MTSVIRPTYHLTAEEELQAREWWGDYVVNRSDIFHLYWTLYPPPSQTSLRIIGVIVGIIGVLSVVGNGLVVYALSRSEKLRKQKLFTINLSLSDVLSCGLTYHMFVASSFNGHWMFSKAVCNYYAATQGIFGFISITSMAAIALERYASIASPRSRWNDMTYTGKLVCTGAIWIYCFIVVSGPLYGMGNYQAAGFLNTCCFDYINRGWRTRMFIFFLFVFGFVIPMIVITYCYFYIYRATAQAELTTNQRMEQFKSSMENLQLSRKHDPPQSSKSAQLERLDAAYLSVAGNRTNRSSSNASEISNASSQCSSTVSNTFQYRIKGKDKRAAQLCLLMVIIFVVAWTPYAIVALLGQFGPDRILTPWMCMIPSVIAKSSTLYNPVLYLYKDTRFQRAFKKYILCQELPEGIQTDSMTTQFVEKKIADDA